MVRLKKVKGTAINTKIDFEESATKLQKLMTLEDSEGSLIGMQYRNTSYSKGVSCGYKCSG
jgi:hypothetical protein